MSPAPPASDPPPRRQALWRSTVRFLLILLLVLLAREVVMRIRAALEAAGAGGDAAMIGLMGAGVVLYALLMAIPFVPGIEIGVALLAMHGKTIAPFVFFGTFSGLTLAFLAGRLMPLGPLERALRDLHLIRAADLVARIAPLDRDQRLALIRQVLPRRLAPHLLRWRYLAIAIALNVPGNAVIGGGGGIALLAGLSGLFSTRATLATFALAVSPVPILIVLFGLEGVPWLR